MWVFPEILTRHAQTPVFAYTAIACFHNNDLSRLYTDRNAPTQTHERQCSAGVRRAPIVIRVYIIQICIVCIVLRLLALYLANTYFILFYVQHLMRQYDCSANYELQTLSHAYIRGRVDVELINAIIH